MNKKIIWGILGIVVIIIALVSMNVLQKNAKEAEEKKKREASYVQAAAEFYNNIELMGFVADFVLPQYSESWSKAIDERRNFNIALNAKKKSLNSMVAQSSVIYSDMEGQLKTVSEAAKENPNKYKELYDEYKKMYGIITSLKEQTESPSGTLITFNQNVNMLFQEYKKYKGNIDVAISEDIKNEVEKIQEKNKK
jgi:biopolymer transport protein ExbB/TolQ